MAEAICAESHVAMYRRYVILAESHVLLHGLTHHRLEMHVESL